MVPAEDFLPTGLTHLDLFSVRPSSVQGCMQAICKLAALRELRFHGNCIFTSLHLSFLALSGCLPALSGLRSLRELYAYELTVGEGCTDAEVCRGLNTLTSLTQLHWARCSMHLNALALDQLVNISRMHFGGLPNTSFRCCSTWQALQELDFWKRALMDVPANLPALGALTSLRVLGHGGFQVQAPLEFIECLPNLNHLVLMHSVDTQRAWSPESVSFLLKAEAVAKRRQIEAGRDESCLRAVFLPAVVR